VRKIRAEIKAEILEGESSLENLSDKLTNEKISNISYTSMCIKEALRIDPPTIGPIPYEARRDFTLSNGIKIFKGMKCTPSIAMLHNNEQIWGNPRAFIPERFDPLSEHFKTPSGDKRHPMSYIPFVAGPRNCVGQNFALIEIKHLAIYLLANFSFESELEDIDASFTIPLRTFLPMKITKLHSIDDS